MKKIILFLSITLAAGVLLTNIYTSLIDATSWGSDIPNSIQTARDYFRTVNPGNFFRIFSPANQILALLTLILFWKKSKSARLYFAIALVLSVVGDIFTFAYFYPRNLIMFENPIAENIEQIKAAWTQWNQMNWVRSLVGAIELFFSFKGLDAIYKAEK